MTIPGKVTLITGGSVGAGVGIGARLVLTGGAGVRLLPQDARARFELNLFAPPDMARRAAALMRGRRGGMMVNISSIAGRVTLPWLTTEECARSVVTPGGALMPGILESILSRANRKMEQQA